MNVMREPRVLKASNKMRQEIDAPTTPRIRAAPPPIVASGHITEVRKTPAEVAMSTQLLATTISLDSLTISTSAHLSIVDVR